ncbi:MAG: T9SS type A sorting domain-containing protein [Ferruginibacter sp.]|nr:T9SS type A sorting domain-containing protein [Ferruginibacter sp.]
MNFKILLTTSFLAAALSTTAQKNTGYAITGDGNNDFIWMNIRQVDIESGQVTKTIFERSKTNYQLIDVNTGRKVAGTAPVGENIFSSADYPTSTFVAAAALDARSNKLFFTPMRMGELRWLDLNVKGETPMFYTLRSPVLRLGDGTDEANNITRMVIAPNGLGYAITNDGNNFFQFSTGKLPEITNLGNLIDDEANKGVSIHNKCTSWGGDMVADAFGKLYVISANKNVFVIDPETRIATYKGAISGLPVNYTTNGAAVSNDGDIVVVSANFFEGYYKVKLADLKATKIEGSDVRFNAADLANSNFLLQKERDEATRFEIGELPQVSFTNGNARVFPNPVTGNTFYITLDGQKEGRYQVILSDLSGRTLQTQKIQVTKGRQNVEMRIDGRPAKGVYMVQLVNTDNRVVFTDKVVLE